MIAKRFAGEDAEQPVVHFDATERRKQKMRKASEQREPSDMRPLDASAPGANGNAAPLAKSAPACGFANGPASELDTFLIELHQYLSESPAQQLDQYPTLARVAYFLRQAQHGGNVHRPSDEKPAPAKPLESPVHGATPPQVVTDAPALETDTASGTRRSVLDDPQALEAFMIDFVVEQTGYPREVVELDADLEADLGIDSIKKAQLFAELRDYFEIDPNITRSDLSLDDFPTLRHVVDFIQNAGLGAQHAAAVDFTEANGAGRGIEPAATPASRTVRPPENGPLSPASFTEPDVALEANTASGTRRSVLDDPQALEAFMIDFVVEQTGYPREVVELDADLEADLGIDSIKKAQLFAELRDYFEIDPNITRSDLSLDDFPTLRHVVDFIQNAGHHPGQSAGLATAAAEAGPAPGNGYSGGAEDAGQRPAPPAADQIICRLGQLMVEKGVVEAPAPLLTRDTRLIDDLGLDSVMILKLATAVEREFDIKLDLDELRLDVLNSAGAFVSLIDRKLAAQG